MEFCQSTKYLLWVHYLHLIPNKFLLRDSQSLLPIGNSHLLSIKRSRCSISDNFSDDHLRKSFHLYCLPLFYLSHSVSNSFGITIMKKVCFSFLGTCFNFSQWVMKGSRGLIPSVSMLFRNMGRLDFSSGNSL